MATDTNAKGAPCAPLRLFMHTQARLWHRLVDQHPCNHRFWGEGFAYSHKKHRAILAKLAWNCLVSVLAHGAEGVTPDHGDWNLSATTKGLLGQTRLVSQLFARCVILRPGGRVRRFCAVYGAQHNFAPTLGSDGRVTLHRHL